MKYVAETKEKILVIVGLIFVSLGLIMNEWVLAVFFSSDGIIAIPHRIVIWIFDLFLISLGLICIKYRTSLPKEKRFIIAGLLLISAGIFFNSQYLSVLFGFDMGFVLKTTILILDIFLILAGIFFILFRKSIQKRNILLFGFTVLFCFISFFLLDGLWAMKHLFLGTIKNSEDHIFVQDDRLGWKPQPNTSKEHIIKGTFNVLYKIDKDGFRKIKNAENHDFSIYFFGDSFTFGHGVGQEDNFPSVIKEKYFNKNINVYNAGVNGYGIVQMFQRFLNIEDRIKPGDLIIFTPLADDILRNVKDFYFPYFHYFANLVQFEYYPVFDKGKIKYHTMESGLYKKLKILFLYMKFSGQFWRSIHKKFVSTDTNQEAAEMIKIIKHRTEMKNAKFVLFFLPETGECLKGDYTVDISNFSYLDIRDYFPSKKEELDKLKFSSTDGHWNVKGHKIAARAIVETLIKEDIIDRKYLKSELTTLKAPVIPQKGEYERQF
jgi:lysophospholipase L1-like esterase